ncbi:MAG: FAD-dependent oxidoreductase, partial [Xanthomonadales bacterium]|nr:FAD-dependent oxidoreductase [Xanthomonadales bacterium]
MSLIDALPARLGERAVELNAADAAAGEFVLFWAHHALRVHENPALETAALLALKLDLPLLVYQGLGGRHRYNSDRHHRFILESARDFAGELPSVGLSLAFHLPADPTERGPLHDLIGRSAAVVSEIYPVPPFPGWYEAHRSRNPDRPWLLVDAACNFPMPLGRPYTRAFQFRKAFGSELDQRIGRDWEPHADWPRPFEGDPGFGPFDLGDALDEAIARCRIDHSIPPVADTPGGSHAGYARWSDFLEGGLDNYARLRNDAAIDGVSRMSPYLHYGCVSPFRIAREARAHGGKGAEKFLDELLIWRELSHHFCFHAEALESLAALPDWARSTLTDHQSDPRSTQYDWEQLLRGVTAEPLWDLAQRSLLRRGELHNNVRMTWGKAFLPWVDRPQRALKFAIDLNHRLALDGNDPNSYGGLLWCFGQFDRPFEPPSRIFGTVRGRSIKRHASRLDMGRYARRVSLPAGGRRLRIAVLGAGLSGLAAARVLHDQGHDVAVVDKARGPGGRMSTRREGDYRFDHGAQYFTARDPRFLRHVLAWQERGVVEEWNARLGVIDDEGLGPERTPVTRYVPVPGMNAVCRDMAGDLPDCRYGWRAEAARFDGECWHLSRSDGETLTAELLVVTAPPAQATQLIDSPELSDRLAGVELLPCWTIMAVFDRPLLEDVDAAFVNAGPLAWVCNQSSGPQRPAHHAWVLQATPEWSLAQLEEDPERVTQSLIAAAARLPKARPVAVEFASAHRWRYSIARTPLNEGALWFDDQRLAIAGDWCHGSRVEGAFLSGVAAAGRIMGS